MEDLSIWSADDLKKNDGLMRFRASSSSSLLKNKKSRGVEVQTKVVSAANSAISLHTLYDNTRGPEEAKVQPSIGSFDRWENPYEFLTDGARAAKAFCRPFPIAVVGVPKDIQFNISKAEFKLTIVVRSDDVTRGRRSRRLMSSSSPSILSSASSSSSDLLDLQDDPSYEATEIYIPLVHYAHQGLLTSPDDPESVAVRGWRGRASAYVPDAATSSTTLVAVPSSSDEPCLLDIDVRVSGGKWSVSGQVLKWWYPVPEGDEGEREYTISVRRMGGAIMTQEEKERQGCLGRLWSSMCAGLSC